MRTGTPPRFTIQGVRAGAPSVAPGRFGIHTTCFTLALPGELLIIDAGTGLSAVDGALATGPQPRRLTLLLTHGHVDHLSGLPPFSPLYRRDRPRVRVLAAPAQLASVRNAVRRILTPPLWPVSWRISGARLNFAALPPAGRTWRMGPVTLSWCPVWHPQRCLALRLEAHGRVLVVATDREPGRPMLDRRFRAFCRDVDWLVLDAQYTPAEAKLHEGWGHGNWQEAAQLARDAGVGRLILTHHDAARHPSAIGLHVQNARRIFPRTDAATEGMTFDLG
jgi:ribonuclease BN (tRNA processing enzyme)